MPTQITIQTFDGALWVAPYPAGHKDDKLEFNRTQHQTRGSERAFLSGAGTRKPVVMEVEIPCNRKIPAGVSWDDGTNSREMVIRRREFWERVLENAQRWYCGARYREVLGLQLLDRSSFHAVRGNLLIRNPNWYLGPDDQRPRRFPLESGLGLYPFGMLYVTAEGDGYYEVDLLGGVLAQESTYVAPYTGLVFHPLDLSYEENL